MGIKIHPLSEGVFTIGHDKIFHLFDVDNHVLEERSIGSLLVEIQPFLIQINGKNILLDTGLGFTLPTGELQLHHNLRRIGIEPEQVHSVILSHLHKDHAGGISFVNAMGIETLSFPNATYYVSKKEFEYAMQNGAPSYVISDIELLQNSPQVEWLDDEGNLHNMLQYQTVGGHCPFHISMLFHADGEYVFFGGDVVPQYKQLITRYIAKYDFDGKKCMELRQQFAEEGKENHWTFLFYHDVKTPFAKL